MSHLTLSMHLAANGNGEPIVSMDEQSLPAWLMVATLRAIADEIDPTIDGTMP